MRSPTPILCASLFALASCSCPNPSGAGSADGGGGTDDAAAAMPVNGCTAADFAANDRRAESAARVIAFPSTPAPGPYTPRCITVSAGQTVTWNGDFASHPLEQFGGNESSWIAPTNRGSTANFVFPVAGVYGFRCTAHPAAMQGAVLVR